MEDGSNIIGVIESLTLDLSPSFIMLTDWKV